MINILLTIFLLTGISGKIQGVVTDEDTGEPIPYADIIILDTEIGNAADEEGNFYILNVPPGKYTVEFSCVGYQTKQIENVLVKIDQVVRLELSLIESPIEIEPITVFHKPPVVEKDWTSTTYIIRKEEITTLPIDYMTYLIQFQPSVARPDTSLHVRGGRATEVNYLIDNVSIIDPLTGDPAINISKGVIDEVIFLPGSFDAEYGRAMSGVINLITERPSDNLRMKVYGKTERIVPFYYDFGYQNYQSSIHVPVSKRFKGLLFFDLMHTDDWDPRLYKLPHKQRDDYSLYGKWLFIPSGKLRLSLSSAQSRTQFDRYASGKARFIYDHWRSDMRKGNLQALTLNYMPDSKTLFDVILSRLYTKREYGVKELRDYGLFENFAFRHYTTLKPICCGYKNPWGVYSLQFYTEGDYGTYQDNSSEVLKCNISTNMQVHKYHEVKTGFEYTYQNLKNFTYFLSNDTIHPIADEWQYFPVEYALFAQDNIDYKGLYSKIGCRYDYFSSDIEGVKPKTIVSPRLGFSFMVTEKFLFRANIGRYVQPPLYDYMYTLYTLIPFPSYMRGLLVGNPNLKPEKTVSYEVGLQGEIKHNLIATINTYYKDVSDLTGTRFVPALPSYYISYFNVEYANVKGIESILEFATSKFNGKISYTLSWARGTSSYAEEVYYRYYYENPDTSFRRQAKEYYLDFDQRHRIFFQGVTKLPWKTTIYLFGYFGNGFPYTPPGPEGKYEERNIAQLPFHRQIDCVISKPFRIGKISLNANLEIINVVDARYEISPHSTFIRLENIKPWHFTDYISITQGYYSPNADFNHDGLITPYEEYTAYRELVKATDDWVNANSAPRRARIGVSVDF